MEKINRRRFIQTSAAGLAGMSVIGSGLINMGFTLSSDVNVDKVKLGKTGLKVSRIAMGTGTHGYNHGSDQTRQGMDGFVKMAHHAYERGITFFDMADAYGSMPYVGKALKTLPRKKVTLLSKMWTHENDSEQVEPVDKIIDRFRKETGSEYFDILLMHCIMKGGWSKNRTHYMDGLSKAKQDGIVKAVGVSCHNWDALVEAAECPWVDVIMARINPFRSHMDGAPEAVSEILGKARANGKGIIGMKIFGEGEFVKDDERQQSLEYALSESNIHSMTLGLASIAQMDDAIGRVMKIVKR
ncbi:MAG: aldo/keto reductase [Tannerella sp.]|jgi:predicted aldo/keto reductase-like oxidoreductase|nr:aldo/keto reductase [Tannerella sp.]